MSWQFDSLQLAVSEREFGQLEKNISRREQKRTNLRYICARFGGRI